MEPWQGLSREIEHSDGGGVEVANRIGRVKLVLGVGKARQRGSAGKARDAMTL